MWLQVQYRVEWAAQLRMASIKLSKLDLHVKCMHVVYIRFQAPGYLPRSCKVEFNITYLIVYDF